MLQLIKRDWGERENDRTAMQVTGTPQQLPFCNRSGRGAVTVRRDCTIGRIDGTGVRALITVPL